MRYNGGWLSQSSWSKDSSERNPFRRVDCGQQKYVLGEYPWVVGNDQNRIKPWNHQPESQPKKGSLVGPLTEYSKMYAVGMHVWICLPLGALRKNGLPSTCSFKYILAMLGQEAASMSLKSREILRALDALARLFAAWWRAKTSAKPVMNRVPLRASYFGPPKWYTTVARKIETAQSPTRIPTRWKIVRAAAATYSHNHSWQLMKYIEC